MLRLICRKQFHGLKNQMKGGRVGKRPALKMGQGTKSWKFLSKQCYNVWKDFDI
jgi:hypothetical protein